MKEVAQLVFGVAVLAGGVYIAWRLRNQIREKIAAWLRDHGLEKSKLMDVLIVCDNMTTVVNQKLVCKIFAITQETGEQEVSEEMLSPETLENLYPDVYAQLQKQGHVRESILQQLT